MSEGLVRRAAPAARHEPGSDPAAGAHRRGRASGRRALFSNSSRRRSPTIGRARPTPGPPGSSWDGARRAASHCALWRRSMWRPTSGRTRGAVPTVKQHLAAIRVLCDWLVVTQVLPTNPAAAVRGPKHVVTKGATPVLTAEETRTLLDAIDTGTVVGLRDRALIGVMVYSFARVSGGCRDAPPGLLSAGAARVAASPREGRQAARRAGPSRGRGLPRRVSRRRGGRRPRGAPLSECRSGAQPDRAAADAGRRPGHDQAPRCGRGAPAVGPAATRSRATGITAYLSNGGTLEHAQQIAAHASPKTTKLYGPEG